MSDASSDSIRELASGYALGTLSPEEARAFEAALADSPELQHEVAEFRELGALLALQQGLAPSRELKQRLRERIAASKTRELSPRAARPSAGRWLVGTLVAAALAASALLSVGLFLRVRTLQLRLSDAQQRLAERQALLRTLLEPSVQLTTLTATGEAPPVVQVFWNRARRSLLLNAIRLKPAPQGRAYQLWLMPKHGNPIPSRVFNTQPNGQQLVQGIPVPENQNITGFALTEEPASGSPQPTSTPILFGTTGGS